MVLEASRVARLSSASYQELARRTDRQRVITRRGMYAQWRDESCLSYQRIRETIFRKAANSNRTKPPTKSRPIHDLPLPLATSESSNAMNHNSKASLRITSAE